MNKMNNKGFMIIEVLVVTVVVMVIFLLIYSNYYPLVGEYERRLEYSNVEAKYSLFNVKKIYTNQANDNRNKIREDFANTDTKYIDLLENIGGNIVCKSRYILNNDQVYCNTLVDSLGITNMLVSQYNTVDIKDQNIDKHLNKYIDYLPEYSSFINDNTMYRMIVKTEDGYATAKLDIDLIGLDITYLEQNDTETTFFPGEKKLFTFTACSSRDKNFYYQINEASGDDFTITNLFNNQKTTNPILPGDGNCQIESLVVQYTGSTNSDIVNIKDLYSISASITAGNFPIDDGYQAVFSNTTLTYNMINNYQKFIAPKTGWYKIEAWGAQGGDGNSTYIGGYGGYTSGKTYLNQGENLYIYIGGQGISTTTFSSTGGYNGGGGCATYYSNYANGCGGGATDVRYGGTTLNDRIMVAGGGGGSQYRHDSSNYGGNGGKLIGGISHDDNSVYSKLYTTGGTQIEGGTTGYVDDGSRMTTLSGAGFGYGGGYNTATWGVNGGGGGYYGGASGLFMGGGGGSSFISGYAGVAAIIEGSATEPNRNHIDSNGLINTKHYSNKYFIDTQMQSGINNGNGKSTIKYLGTTAPTRINTELDGVRYVKNCTNRSSSNEGNHTVEIQAIKNGVNLAAGKIPTESHGYVENTVTPYTNATDGQIDNITGSTGFAFASASSGGEFCLIIDLGAEYDLDEIAVWNYWPDGRTYYANVTSVKGTSGSTYTTVLNNQHRSTSEGNRISAYRAKPTQRTLTLNLNGGTTTYPTSYSIIEGDSVVLKDPTRVNYTFTGWTCAGTGCSTSTNVVSIGTTDATATAQWRANTSLVTLNNQSATTAGTTSVTAFYSNAMPAITVPTKTGYTFGGYYTQTGGGGTQYYTAAGASARNWDITIDTTLYAKWTPNTYTIVFNANSANGGSTASKSCTYDVACTLTANGYWYVVEGASGAAYKYLGWATSAAGAVVYGNSASVTNLTSTHGATVTLYAKWGSIFSHSSTKYVYSEGSGKWRVELKAGGTFTLNYATAIDIYVVGGGGGSGTAHSYKAAGAGGGGGSATTLSYSAAAGAYTAVVGAGGVGPGTGYNGTAGGVSSFALGSTVLASAKGGSGGKSDSTYAGAGGAGGTATVGTVLVTGGAGGTGAQTSSAAAGAGGKGNPIFNDTSYALYYGAGGGGGGYKNNAGAVGGYGNTSTGVRFGGAGSTRGVSPSVGTANTGSGAGGPGGSSGGTGAKGVAGGTGVVIIRNTR